jgi:osmoprotectant transport system substrate-binding protein
MARSFRPLRRARRAVVLLPAVAMLAVSCGSGGAAESDGATVRAEDVKGPLADYVDLEDADFWIGSDDTTSQRVLGAIAAELLESTGAKVEDRTGLGNPFLVRDSLKSGEIDMAWSGTGQAWTGFLREPELPPNADELYAELASRDLEQNGVAWMSPLGFSAGRGMAIAAARGEELDVTALSDIPDLLDEVDNPTICVTSEFATFPEDGRLDFEETLGVTLEDDQVRVYDPEPIYADTGSGLCLLGQVQRTSGRIPAYDLELLTDDEQLFMVDHPAMAVREEVLEDNPELELVFAVLSERMDEESLRELNERVEVDGDDTREVARDWLRDEKLID